MTDLYHPLESSNEGLMDLGFLESQRFTIIQLWMISLCERGVDLLGFGSADALAVGNHLLNALAWSKAQMAI